MYNSNQELIKTFNKGVKDRITAEASPQNNVLRIGLEQSSPHAKNNIQKGHNLLIYNLIETCKALE